MMEPLFQLFEGLERLGPGSETSTMRALAMLPALPPRPRILDLGCGTGASTLVLARETAGDVTAVDMHRPFLDLLHRRATDAGLAAHITTRLQSMDALDGPPASYDLLWSEGAIYLVGFERGLRLWRPLLRPGGYACITEASWLTNDPPRGAREFWKEAYPEMGTIEENIRRARAAGYEPIGAFTLPRSDWETGLYAPLQARMAELHGNPELASVIEETKQEIRLFEEYGDSYGYAFYVLKSV